MSLDERKLKTTAWQTARGEVVRDRSERPKGEAPSAATFAGFSGAREEDRAKCELATLPCVAQLSGVPRTPQIKREPPDSTPQSQLRARIGSQTDDLLPISTPNFLAHVSVHANTRGVPILSTFFGIIVRMFHGDHNPPHYHVQYGEYEAILDVETGRVLEGTLPKRVAQLVKEWHLKHKKELRSSWEQAQEFSPLQRIKGLE